MNSAALQIECSDQPLDFCFHASRPSLLAAALVDGTLEIHDFADLLDDDEEDSLLSSTPVHTQLLPTQSGGTKQASCRSVLFTKHGDLYTGGTGGDLAKLDTEIVCTFTTKTSPKSVLWRINDAAYNKAAVHVLHEIPENAIANQGLLVSGDDIGGVRVWDPRLMGTDTADNKLKKKPTGCLFSWKEHEDYVSSIDHSADGMTLLSASADGTLCVYDLRMAQQPSVYEKDKIVRRSDVQDDELLSLKVMKNGKKVVCGTGMGVLNVWSWGTWGDISDRFPGHPNSLDGLVKVDEDTLLTGSSDGLIRVVTVHPDKFLGVLGDHEEFPIEKLAFTSDRKYIGSLSHDNLIRLWDAAILGEDYDGDAKMSAAPTVHVTSEAHSGDEDGWDDVDDDEDMKERSTDDDDSDSSEDDDRNEDQRAGRFKTDNEKFFEDL
ncbi:hypothetical protein FisN_28Hh034 [Fistulifera solaris]|uniref:Uncharacterized protein n=1 Tax=Fistulifera solaris TaxID=1519565 RepID=A0A1Z5KHH1_FISSO|nr:hypothetical protein FisN_28Hh034 [Fistulifera solaris]|eukprot:GAX25565.1 hypothetical protein FisN_28Hh034 [Fistulifera solaris]